MPRRTPASPDREVQTSLRIPESLLSRADAVAEALAKSTGIAGVSRSQCLRSAIELGLGVLEQRHKPAAGRPAK